MLAVYLMYTGAGHAEVMGDLGERQARLAHRHDLRPPALHQTIITVPSFDNLRFRYLHPPTLSHSQHISK